MKIAAENMGSGHETGVKGATINPKINEQKMEKAKGLFAGIGDSTDKAAGDSEDEKKKKKKKKRKHSEETKVIV